MSQINDRVQPLSHYETNSLEPKPSVDDVPEQLQNARPASSSSGWKIAGRIALGIFTVGISELIRAAYQGIKSLITNCSPAPQRESRIPEQPTGLPQAEPKTDRSNDSLASAVAGKKAFPPEYQSAVDDVLKDLRAQYGEKYIPKNASLKDLTKALNEDVVPHAGAHVFHSVKYAQDPVQPNDLKRIIQDKYVSNLNKTIFAKITAEKVSQIGGFGGVNASYIAARVLARPGMEDQIASCKNEGDIRNLVQTINLEQELKDCRSAMEKEIHTMCTKYGVDDLPLDQALSLAGDDGQTVESRINGPLSTGGEFSAAKLAKNVKEDLGLILSKQAVENALSQKAQKMGVPLPRRAAVELSSSILAEPQNKNAFAQASNSAEVQNCIDNLGIDKLITAQKEGIENAYNAHAEKLSPELRPLFRTFLEGCPFNPSSLNETNRAINDLVGRMQHWKNCDGSEEERKPLNDYFKQIIGDDLKMLESVPGSTDNKTGYEDNIYKTLIDDAHRSDYSINGVQIPRNHDQSVKQLSATLKETLPDAKDQKFMSKLINQRLWANVHLASGKGILENGTLLSDLPGGKTLPAGVSIGKAILSDVKDNKIPSTFTVNVSSDKKTAEVTSTMTQRILYDEYKSIDGQSPHYGGVKFTFTFKLNLSAHENGQSVQDVRLSQKFISSDELKKM